MSIKQEKIFIAGHKGMVGSSIRRNLINQGYKNIYTISKTKLDLLNQQKVFEYFKKKKFNSVYIAAARVGGILANDINKPKFIYENLQIQNNLIHSSYLTGVKNLIFLGSSCIYPKEAKTPIKENQILTGPLESTNEAYAIAKISGIKMCEYYKNSYNLNYKSLMPSNIYGVGDNYDTESSHFFPALIKKIHLAKINKLDKVVIWGSGRPRRELIYVDDVAKACTHLMHIKCKESVLNVGYGKDYPISFYVKFIMKKLNFYPKIVYDKSKPDGTYRKLLDNSLSYKYGWKPSINLDNGFEITYKDFMSQNN